MRVYKNIVAGVVGAFAFAGVANAATVTMAGHVLEQTGLADEVEVKTGGIMSYDVNGGSPTENEAIGGTVGDGVRCATDGCSFMVKFHEGVENQVGNDLIIFGLGGGGPELFDLAYNGVRINNLQTVASGHFEGGFEIFYLEIDLESLGVALNDMIHEIKVIVRAGSSTEEFSAFASMNDVAVPLPAAVWLFGSVLAAGGLVGRRKQAAKKAAAKA